ncbi:hypothetical protein GCM10007973_22740 [Polymorphobacter multimanifer]|uniref:Uncharacterized protein n=1 Tax=Polymorphobacter multimanifer TaxID=1070431 RepID=A0A841LGJ1_9SPHN|nr:hypothetical protein [Polymorphobacter multimanifer]MBB6228915.1 hypothetical protein [Polymorphobacter multimanifer]GGI85664.1 hypothetical protein GCM10007973_22740 [Polymorphobacter multimanifer]
MRIAPVNTWFKPKRIGWGWTPARPEGWAAIAAFIVLLAALAG